MVEKGITRREFIKFGSISLLYTLFPNHILEALDVREVPRTRGKGLIFVVGDGMPLGVIRAMHEVVTRTGRAKNTYIYEFMTDRRTKVAYMGTKSLSSIVTDSAPASVAWATGSKTANRMLACLPDGTPLKTIMELLKERGYACGLVTTTRITHATPAAWVSHNLNRDAEDEIALDYLPIKVDVLLGGGNRHFDPEKRKDKKDIYNLFQKGGYDIVRDKKELLKAEIIHSKKPLLGVFNDSHLSYYVDRINNPELGERQPSLPEMTLAALYKLSQNSKGFILQVEAGRIDHANHANDAWAAIMDAYEMDLTLGLIKEFVRINPETLVIITSDHGNSGWGINGTGPEYNHATSALLKYVNIKASFEVIKKALKGKSKSEIRDIIEYYTNFSIGEDEAEMIYASMQKDFIPYPGDFKYQPEATLGKILAHSLYPKGGESPLIRRGNVGFTSTNHTAEDQIVLMYGRGAKEIGLPGYIDNTDLFKIMCRHFGISYKNPSMREEDAKPFIKTASMEEWRRHLELHIA